MWKYKEFIMYWGLFLLFVSFSHSVDVNDDYNCSHNSICVPYRSCNYEDRSTLKWCDQKGSKVCCPKSVHKDKTKSYEYERHGRDGKEYKGNKDLEYLYYYEDSYSGPVLSREAKRILRNYDERECGVRRSFHGRTSTHEAELRFAKYGEFPWQAAILLRTKDSGYKPAYKYICGATVINPAVILTAAHCIKGIRIRHLTVKLGDWNLKGTRGEMFPTIPRLVKKVIVHNYYDSGTFAHDIAILILSKPVNLRETPHVSPICLPPKHTKFAEHAKCYIVGWGSDIYKPNYGSNILKVATVSLMKEECPHKLKESIPSLSKDFFKDDLTCISGTFGKDACIGDAGGAVICPLSNDEVPVCKRGYSCKDQHYFLAGIISWGSDKCGKPDSITVVTDFQSHRDWLESEMRPYGGIDSYDYEDHYDYNEYGYDHDYDGYEEYNYAHKHNGYDHPGRYGKRRYDYDHDETYNDGGYNPYNYKDGKYASDGRDYDYEEKYDEDDKHDRYNGRDDNIRHEYEKYGKDYGYENLE